MKGYVINLKHETEKLKLIQQTPNFKEVFEVFEAVDGTNGKLDILDIKDKFDYLKAFEVETRPLSMAEICCAISHNEVYNLIAQDTSISDDEFVLVCEDDIIFIDDWYNKVQLVISLVQNIKDIHLVNFQQSFIDHFNPLNYHERNFKYDYKIIRQFKSYMIAEDLKLFSVLPLDTIRGAAFYMIRKSAAIKVSKQKHYLVNDFWQKIIGEKHILRTNPVLAYARVNESNLEIQRYMYQGVSKYKKGFQEIFDQFIVKKTFRKIRKQLQRNLNEKGINAKLYKKTTANLEYDNSIDFKKSNLDNLKCAIQVNNSAISNKVISNNTLTLSFFNGIDGTEHQVKEFLKEFDFHNAFRLNKRSVTSYEISKSLNHHYVHKLIADNKSIQDQDFILIIDNNAQLVEYWSNQLNKILQKLKPIKSIDLINLSYDGSSNKENSLENFLIEDIECAVTKSTGKDFDSSCYLIRKSLCKKLVKQKKLTNLISDWHLNRFGGSTIHLLNPLIQASQKVEPQSNFKSFYNRVAFYKAPYFTKLKHNLTTCFYKFIFGKRFK